MLSAGSLAPLQGVFQSIPAAGTYLVLWLFADDVPGHQIISRLYWLHVLILPAAIATMFALQHRLPTAPAYPLPGRTGSGRLGSLREGTAAASIAMLFTTCAALTLIPVLIVPGAFFTIRPPARSSNANPPAITARATF